MNFVDFLLGNSHYSTIHWSKEISKTYYLIFSHTKHPMQLTPTGPLSFDELDIIFASSRLQGFQNLKFLFRGLL